MKICHWLVFLDKILNFNVLASMNSNLLQNNLFAWFKYLLLRDWYLVVIVGGATLADQVVGGSTLRENLRERNRKRRLYNSAKETKNENSSNLKSWSLLGTWSMW